jgi:hypothetical protein
MKDIIRKPDCTTYADRCSDMKLARNHTMREGEEGCQLDCGTKSPFLAMYPGRGKQACRYGVWLVPHFLQSHKFLGEGESLVLASVLFVVDQHDSLYPR